VVVESVDPLGLDVATEHVHGGALRLTKASSVKVFPAFAD